MKNYLKLSALAGILVMAVSCDQKKNDAESATADEPVVKEADYQEAIADRDTLFSLMADINDGILQIKELENIITVDNNETPNRRAQILRDIRAIQASIAERQRRLAELEQKLNASNQNTTTLQKTIESLRGQIESQQADIQRLTNELGVANETITQQTAQIDTLNTTVQTVSSELATSQEDNVKLTNQMNTCYYVIGSEKELKQHKILEKKFLRSEKVLKGDFDQSYFTTADKRRLTVIPLYAKKAEVKTNQPKDSYQLRTTPNGQLELVILKPDDFWKLTDYLVIQTK